MSDDLPPMDIVDYDFIASTEAVRRRPGMYIGGTDQWALHQMLFELLNLAINEAFDGKCQRIGITLGPDHTVIIRDDSEGLPIEIDERFDSPKFELLFTRVSHYDPLLKRYVVSGGMFGVGPAACNAICEWMSVEATCDGHWWCQSYDMGYPRVPLTRDRPIQPGEPTGRVITFKPDLTIFNNIPDEVLLFRAETIAHRCHEIAYQIPELTISVRDERNEAVTETVFHEPEGIRGLIKHQWPLNCTHLHDCIYAQIELTTRKSRWLAAYDFMVSIAIQFTDGTDNFEHGYVNSVETIDGGAHMTGLARGLVTSINKHLPVGSQPSKVRDLPSGLLTVISLRHPNPQFERQTTIRLVNKEVHNPIKRATEKAVDAFAAAHPKQMQRIVEHCIANRAHR